MKDYDSGLLNDFGGGNTEWWWDYIRAELARCNEHWRGIHDQQRLLMVRIYNNGYDAGHNDTVESKFTLISPQDMDTYHADVVEEIISENVV